jgi:hypothetical protein
LREVARYAGISPATVSDVRKRLESGQAPVAERQEVAVGGARSEVMARIIKPRADRIQRQASADTAAVVENC